MTLRSWRDRALQTCLFEIGGICLISPLYALTFGAATTEAASLILVLALVAMIWSPLHNTVFDVIDLRLTGRLASDRPHRWRLIHAFSHEMTMMAATVPVLIWIGGHGFWVSVAVDLGLTLFYTTYAYGFHMAYDRLRPIRAEPRPERQPRRGPSVSATLPVLWLSPAERIAWPA